MGRWVQVYLVMGAGCGGCALEAHFGLGKDGAAALTVTLPSGKCVSFPGVKTDRLLDLNIEFSKATEVTP